MQEAQAQNTGIIIELCCCPGHTNVECSCPGHTNVECNEKARTTTKRVVKDVHRATLTGVIPHTDMRRPVVATVKQNWLERWQSFSCEGGKLTEIKPDFRIWILSYIKSRRTENILAWLRIRYSNLTHSCLMEGLASRLECDLCKT